MREDTEGEPCEWCEARVGFTHFYDEKFDAVWCIPCLLMISRDDELISWHQMVAENTTQEYYLGDEL